MKRPHYDGERIEHLHQHVLVMDQKLNLLLARIAGASAEELGKLETTLKTHTDALDAAVKANTPTP